MKEYIERSAAMRVMNKAITERTWSMDNWDVIEQMKENVEILPAADVAPVRHGEWVYDRWCEFKCSNCGHWSNTSPRAREKYCPECGSKMDGGNK